MAHTVTLTDEQFARLQSAATFYNQTPDQVLTNLVNQLPVPSPTLSREDYDRRWDDFMALVGSIPHGAPLTNEEIDQLIGEEASETHADASS